MCQCVNCDEPGEPVCQSCINTALSEEPEGRKPDVLYLSPEWGEVHSWSSWRDRLVKHDEEHDVIPWYRHDVDTFLLDCVEIELEGE